MQTQRQLQPAPELAPYEISDERDTSIRAMALSALMEHFDCPSVFAGYINAYVALADGNPDWFGCADYAAGRLYRGKRTKANPSQRTVENRIRKARPKVDEWQNATGIVFVESESGDKDMRTNEQTPTKVRVPCVSVLTAIRAAIAKRITDDPDADLYQIAHDVTPGIAGRMGKRPPRLPVEKQSSERTGKTLLSYLRTYGSKALGEAIPPGKVALAAIGHDDPDYDAIPPEERDARLVQALALMLPMAERRGLIPSVLDAIPQGVPEGVPAPICTEGVYNHNDFNELQGAGNPSGVPAPQGGPDTSNPADFGDHSYVSGTPNLTVANGGEGETMKEENGVVEPAQIPARQFAEVTSYPSRSPLRTPARSEHRPGWNPDYSRSNLNDRLRALADERGVTRGMMSCPLHDDDNPSVHVDDGERIRMFCHSCRRSGKSILDAIDGGIVPTPVLPVSVREPSTTTGKLARIIATYVYRDAEGSPVYKVLRTDPKGFPTMRFDTTQGRYVKGMAGTARILYRLPELLSADQSETVFVVEGEKAANLLARHGFVVTAIGGATKWNPATMVEPLRGRRVVIIPDNDEPGAMLSIQMLRALWGVAASVTDLTLEGLDTGGDVWDWFAAGHEVNELVRLANEVDEGDIVTMTDTVSVNL